jgi:hypothetical protein
MLDNLMSLVMGLLMIGFGLFCGVMAANLIYQHAINWRAAVKSKSWLTTEGQVTAATAEHTGRYRWTPKITYAYRVNGVEYTGSRVAFDYFDSYSLQEANEMLERYQANAPAKIFYDPEQPQESTLEQIHRGASGGLFILPVILFLPTALCICAGLFGLSDIWKK